MSGLGVKTLEELLREKSLRAAKHPQEDSEDEPDTKRAPAEGPTTPAGSPPHAGDAHEEGEVVAEAVTVVEETGETARTPSADGADPTAATPPASAAEHGEAYSDGSDVEEDVTVYYPAVSGCRCDTSLIDEREFRCNGVNHE